MTFNKEKEVGFIVACKHFFGQKPGQTLREFSAEMKELSDQDREEIKELLIAEGFKIK